MPKFFLRHRTEKIATGPLDAEVVVEMARTGKVHPEDVLQLAGDRDAPWREAWRYQELFPPEVAARYKQATHVPEAKGRRDFRAVVKRKLTWPVWLIGIMFLCLVIVYWMGLNANRRYSAAAEANVTNSTELQARAKNEGRGLTVAEIRVREEKVKALEGAYNSLWPWQRDVSRGAYVWLQKNDIKAMIIVSVPPAIDSNDPKGSFERFFGFYLSYIRLSQAEEAAGGRTDTGVGHLSFDTWDVRQTQSLRDPIAGEASGEWRSRNLGSYKVTLNFVWRDSKWLATTVETRWAGEKGVDSPDRDAAMKAVIRILSKTDIPTASD